MKHLQFKRIISVLLTIAMFLTMVPATFAASASDFADFPTGWSKEAMAFSVDNGLLNGKSANRIEPAANLTRAEMAAIINRAFGAKVTADISGYSDVNPSDWFYVEMQKAVNMQTFNGDGNGRLRPNDAITREEVMTVIARAMVLEQTDYSPLNKYADVDKFSDWAKPYAAALVAGGYVNGLGNGKINPKVNITREEFAQLMYNIFKTYISKQGTYNSVTPKNCVMINQPNIARNNVTIYGDLVLGDGVGSGIVTLTNVKIMGRLLARGGNITLTNVTTGNGVVVKNVNGTTHFNNYKTEPVFNGVRELTYTTYKQTGIAIGGGGGGGGRPPMVNPVYYTYTINYYYMDRASLNGAAPTWSLYAPYTETVSVEEGTTVSVPAKATLGGYNYVLNTTESDITPGTTFVVNSNNIVYNVYYDLQTVKVEHSDGSTEFVPVKTEETPRQAVDELASQGITQNGATIGNNTYDIEWSLVGPNGQMQTITDWDQVIPEGWHIAYELIAKVTLIRDDNTSEEINVYVGDTIPAVKLDVPSKPGYDFDGWFDVADSTKKYDDTTPVVKSPLTIKPKWTAIEYTINYELNSGAFASNYTAPVKYTIEDTVTLPDANVISKSGYEFDGWYNTADFSGIKVTEIVAGTTGNKTFYAKWKVVTVPPTTYNVTYVLNGGNWATGYTAPTQYTKGVALALPVPGYITRDGFTFDGWYDNASFTGNEVTEIPADATGDKTYYAKWTEIILPPEVYNITYVLNGGNWSAGYTAPTQYTKGVALALPAAANVVRDGYTFGGWYDNANLAGNAVTIIPANATGAKTYYAKWLKNTAVTVVFGNGDANDVKTYVEGDVLQKPVDPTRDDYKFVGWFDAEEGGNAITFPYTFTSSDVDFYMYAQWLRQVTVTTEFGNGTSSVSEDYLEGDVLSEPAEPTYEGYKFNGWYTQPQDGDKITFPYTIQDEDDFTIYAQWLKKVKVTYVYGNGEANLVEDYIEGDVLAKPADPVFDGHVFAGWYTAETAGEIFSFPYTIGTADIIIYARWDQFYNVNFYYFNEDLDRKQLDYVAKINVANEDADRDLAFLNKTLDGIYDGYGVAPYVYNRTDLAHPNLDVEYEHEVNAEYIYLDDEGKWSVFTEDTVVNKDIDVYYATKQAVLTIINAPGLPDRFNTLPIDVLYDSESRLADSAKDILITMGITLSNDYIRPEIDEKIVSLYTKLGDKTGMIDTQGNILDKDYGMKIIDVIDYDQIQAEVKLHIENMLNGTPEDLQDVVSLIDMETLVEEIGARELINAIGVASLRDMIKSDEYKGKTIEYIVNKIATDSSVITMVIDANEKFKQDIVEMVAEPDVDEADRSELAKNTKEAIINIINTKDEFEQYRAFTSDVAYNAIVYYYVYGKNSPKYSSFRIRPAQFTSTYKPMIDGVIDDIIDSYYSYKNGETTVKPDGFDVMNRFFNTEVDTFISDNYEDFVDAVDDDFINNYINSMSDKDLNDLVLEYADVDMIVDHITKLSSDDRKNLANKIVDFLDSYKPFVEFMDAFKNKRATFEVNIDNIHFVSAVGNAIYGFDFDEILEILKGKGFEKVIEFVGEDVVKDIFNASKENYWKGLEPVIEAVKADKVPREYTTSMNVAINVPLILEALYDNNANKFIDKVVNTEIYDYDKNTALKELVNLDWFDLFIGYDAARVDEATGMTGYYIRDYMDYYTAVLDIMILFDEALCFYNRAEYDDAEMIEVKKSLTKDVINFLKNLESLSDRIENGEPIYGGFTLEALINKVDSLNKVVDSVGNGALASYEGTIETVINNIKNILTNLGEGDLPAGYTLDDLNALAKKLVNVIEGMNEGEYERVNEDFNEVIAKSLTKLDSILDELDEDGTIAGRPVDAIFSKVSVLNRIYTKFASEIKSIISILADADFDTIDFEADIEKYEDIIFGREEDDIFNIDSVVELVKDRFDNETVEGGYYDAENGYYVIDEYSKEVKEYGVSFQRRFN